MASLTPQLSLYLEVRRRCVADMKRSAEAGLLLIAPVAYRCTCLQRNRRQPAERDSGATGGSSTPFTVVSQRESPSGF
jgi:hypothetical protein